MEKRIAVIARYHYKHGYFVEVSHEDSFTKRRDYWLCRKNSAKKLFMFSSSYKNDATEEHEILTRISEAIQHYENPIPMVKLA